MRKASWEGIKGRMEGRVWVAERAASWRLLMEWMPPGVEGEVR